MAAETTYPNRTPKTTAAALLRSAVLRPFLLIAICAGMPAFVQPSIAQETTTGGGGETAQASVDNTAPVVVEMFLSQSCKSCPPAAEYLTELVARRDLVAIAWHVDYWNSFAARKTGRWRDPFSHASYADRQRRYNKNIRGRNTVFTPQAVVSGMSSSVGFNRERVERNIRQAQYFTERAASKPPAIAMEIAGNALRVSIHGAKKPYDIYLVSFYQNAVTDIAGGDNAGMKFAEAHVVDTVELLAEDKSGDSVLSIPAPGDKMGCAVLVQEPGLGRIVAARYCLAQQSK